MIELKKLIAVGAHFGHQTSRWCPKMERYIWGQKNNVHLINIAETAKEMDRAAAFLKDVVAQGKTILWVGTKKAAQDVMRTLALDLGMPFVTHRWVGGTLSNYTQVKKSVTKLLHFEDVINKSDKFPHYTKKEINLFGKVVERLNKSVGGIKSLAWPIGAIVVADVNKDRSAIKEAESMGIPVVAMVDTNCDPSSVNFVIPANDDAPRVIKLIMEYLGDAVREGKEVATKRSADEAVDAAAKKTDKEFSPEQKNEARRDRRNDAGQRTERRPMTRKPAPKNVADAASDAKKTEAGE